MPDLVRLEAEFMQASARPIDQVVDSMSEALVDLDSHGYAMAALHLAMAVDCLKMSLEAGPTECDWEADTRPQLRLIASS